MKKPVIYDQQVYYRIIALWVLCEAMLGGIIHAFHIPVSGLVVGSSAVICICLIAYYVPTKGSILKATIIVAIFKMMLSPQAPVLAYAAVFFQGALGELLFWNKKLYRISCLLLGFFALLESGFQRIIVLTIVYGNNFWKAINDFINELTKQKSFTDYSFYLITGYVLLHVIVGLIIGWWAGVIPKRILNWQIEFALYKLTAEKNEIKISKTLKKRKKLKTGLLIIWLALILLYFQSYFKIGNPILPASTALYIFIRSVIIVLSWYFLVGPATKFILQNWLTRKRNRRKYEIEKVSDLLPSTIGLMKESWRFSSTKKGFRRIIFFARFVLAKSMIAEIPMNKVFILTGEIHSGKTTSLLEWIDGRNDVKGILTPMINNERIFFDIETKQKFKMEAAGEEEFLSIGRYKFSKQNFEKAKAIIQNSIYKKGWLVIDEIGPLELNEQGFHDVLVNSLDQRDQKILLVVRNSILEEVKNKFQIENAVVVSSINDLGSVKTLTSV